MEKPGAIYVPILYAGSAAEISWDQAEGATGYQLERDAGNGFLSLYSGDRTAYTDTIPDVPEVRYRVRAIRSGGMTWGEIESMSWGELDERGWWQDETSEWTETDAIEVIPNKPPVISGQDEHLGSFYENFSVSFTVEDDDPGASVSVEVFLDDESFRSYPQVVLGQSYSLQIDVSSLDIDSDHVLVIEATDNVGAKDARTYTFRVVEDLISDAKFYVVRDGEPIAKLTEQREWVDYLAVGTHTYKIRGVDKYDNYSDSNEVTITLALDGPLLAPLDAPEKSLNLLLRRNEPPEIAPTTTTPNVSEMYFEGRKLPVIVGFDSLRRSQSLSFTSTTLEDDQRIRGLVGKLLVYRDQYDDKMIAVITSLEQDRIRRRMGPLDDAVIDFAAVMQQTAYSEGIDYD